MSGKWLLCRHSRPEAKVRLYCFPHLGGSPGEYLRWSNALPSTVEVWAAELPGRGSRHDERPYRDMGALVRDLLREAEFRPPFVFFGHSMGALVAYEVAKSAPPQLLVVSGYAAPHLPRRTPPARHLPDRELVRLLDLPDEVAEDEEYLAEVLAVQRADLEMVETYTDGAATLLDLPITVVSGLDDDGEPAELLAWKERTTGRFELHLLPGAHFYLRAERDALLRLIMGSLS